MCLQSGTTPIPKRVLRRGWSYLIRHYMFCQSAKQSNEKFDASQLHDREKRKHKTEILPDDGTGDVEVNTIPLFTHLSLKTLESLFVGKCFCGL